MSSVFNISEIASKNVSSLEVTELQERIRTLEKNILSLAAEKQALALQLGSKYTEPTPEELICTEQIQILKYSSENRELSLDEIKRLDILIKNLTLLREIRTKDAEIDADYLTEEQLVAIATATNK